MQELEKEEYLGQVKYLKRSKKGLSVLEVDYERKVFEGWHSHKNVHLTFFLTGGTVEKRRNSSREFAFGEVAFYRSHEPHLNCQTKFPSKNINLEISEQLVQGLGLQESMLENSIKNLVKTRLLILKIYQESLINDIFSEDSTENLVAQLFAGGRYFENSASCPTWVNQLYESLHDNWDNILPLKSLAIEIKVNPITISKYFSKFFGCSYGEFMRKLKTDYAIRFIRERKLSLSEIAYRCGFSDQSHFNRIFKKQTGFSPAKFQRI